MSDDDAILVDAKGRTPEECWAQGDVFLFSGATFILPEDGAYRFTTSARNSGDAGAPSATSDGVGHES